MSRKKPAGPASRARESRGVTARLAAHPGIVRAPVGAAEVYYFKDFLSDAECDSLIAMIDNDHRPSTLLATHEDPEFRTSDSCDLDRWAAEVHALDQRIVELLGLPGEKGETMQGQRYAPGQQFRAHCDYFHETESYWPAMRESGGQRTWTAMAYLNDVEEGGATWFPRAGLRVAPKRRLLLIWNNMQPDGTPNLETLHEGMRVLAGTKYVITKWFREGAWLQNDIATYYSGVKAPDAP
ncbi:MAG: 2OG-Fe(II) oxygenase [Sphingomonas sp.]